MAEERTYLVTISYGVNSVAKYAVPAVTVYAAGNKAEKQFKADYAAEKNFRITSIQESGYVFIR
jgi:hypothetical protein